VELYLHSLVHLHEFHGGCVKKVRGVVWLWSNLQLPDRHEFSSPQHCKWGVTLSHFSAKIEPLLEWFIGACVFVLG
jgi:hypothetical protein